MRKPNKTPNKKERRPKAKPVNKPQTLRKELEFNRQAQKAVGKAISKLVRNTQEKVKPEIDKTFEELMKKSPKWVRRPQGDSTIPDKYEPDFTRIISMQHYMRALKVQEKEILKELEKA